MKKIYLFMLIIGIVITGGAIGFLIYMYIKASNVSNMITPIIFTFIPFAIGFGIISISLKSINKK